MKMRSYLIITLLFIGFLNSCKESNKEHSQDLSSSHENGNYEFTNELIHETSPYLLQHAHNPVNWKPWSQEAFKEAENKGVLVVLSVGYSTCHWCHVMEEESFEDLEVANLMNAKFVSIKVDREERPDLDMVYQTALQLVNGTGGWPMNAIILPDGSPIYLGTYSTKEEWKNILTKFSTEYEANPEKMKEYATMLANGVQEVYEQPAKQLANEISKTKIINGISTWSNSWDREWGGNTEQQKFIIPANLNMLLEYAVLEQDKNAQDFVFKTLDKVSQGGIYDHIGGGFFRYSTDPKWKVPHFEKMLYDNAQMLSVLSNAYKLNANNTYKSLIEDTFHFLTSEMKNPEGGYFSAMDADTNGEEGIYYIWSIEELKSVLNTDYELFAKFFNINDGEVWEHSSFVLYTTESIAEFSKNNSISQSEFSIKLKKWKETLYDARQLRDKPSRDYKIITSWNALLIDGLVDAYKTFNDERYLNEAKLIFNYLKDHNYKNGELVHSYTANSDQKEVFLEDYAFLAKAAISLYEVTLNIDYLKEANKLIGSALTTYKSKSGLFYYNLPNDLVPRMINTTDGVIPSANAIMAQNLFKIGHLEYNTSYLNNAKSMTSLVVDDFENYALNYGSWGTLLLNHAYPYYEIAVVGEQAKNLVQELGGFYLANTLVVGSERSSDISLFKDRYDADDTFVYVCQNNTCKLPVTSTIEAIGQMKSFGYQGLETTQKFSK
ncbi:thioredoxin domain-containing protein [Maribacter sp. MAR_2009_72]|uniref:thioredoxin domain-containing protein n=1 Tax=Maribacter sp. MAR_2009_72 TaxID=1250050 RepID=UPI001199B4C7|nr:thioredoxin domain-containing protein [Maribacter sp. MAR_2009_72]TVZ13992.1 hypothetical protein JM81_0189 [Maribacter sp. MAR_2009_72]